MAILLQVQIEDLVIEQAFIDKVSIDNDSSDNYVTNQNQTKICVEGGINAQLLKRLQQLSIKRNLKTIIQTRDMLIEIPNTYITKINTLMDTAGCTFKLFISQRRVDKDRLGCIITQLEEELCED